jgi:putative DNA methylase
MTLLSSDKPRKKLIEVALPLEAINQASAREKSIRHGHPSTLHLWWSRKPLATCRAMIFAALVDDPSGHPELFPTEALQAQERQRLFGIIERLVNWENSTDQTVLNQAHAEIMKYTNGAPPPIYDPFAGGGSIPLEAQRLGLQAYASDLNPVAVLINKALIEIPPRFANLPPVNPEGRNEDGETRKEWGVAISGSGGMAEGDGSCSGDLSADATTSAGRGIWNALTDHPSGCIDSGEHRGGLGARVPEREGALSGDSTGLTGRSGDAADTMRADRLVCDRRDGASPRLDGRDQPHADHAAPQSSLPALAPPTSFLSPRSSPLSPRSSQGLAADVRYYAQWMRNEAAKRIGQLYPNYTLPKALMAHTSTPLKSRCATAPQQCKNSL